MEAAINRKGGEERDIATIHNTLTKQEYFEWIREKHTAT